jgi:hypothetical protein
MCFVVLHSLQDQLRTGTRDLDHPITCQCKKHQQCPLTCMVNAKDDKQDRRWLYGANNNLIGV